MEPIAYIADAESVFVFQNETRPTSAPSLVALTTSQVPVIAWEHRYMTTRECARLQSMGDLPHLPSVK